MANANLISAYLDIWYRLMKRGRYETFADLRSVFGAADKVGHLFVFDIDGNKMRLVAAIHFNTGEAYVRHVLSHKVYDSETWKRREGFQ